MEQNLPPPLKSVAALRHYLAKNDFFCLTVQLYSTLFNANLQMWCKVVYLQYLFIRGVKFCSLCLPRLIYNITACVCPPETRML